MPAPQTLRGLALHPGVGGQRPGCSPWWEMRVLPHFLFPFCLLRLPSCSERTLSPMYQGYTEPPAGHRAAPHANLTASPAHQTPAPPRPPTSAHLSSQVWTGTGLWSLPLARMPLLLAAEGALPGHTEAALRQPPRSEAGKGGEELEPRNSEPGFPLPTAPRRKGTLDGLPSPLQAPRCRVRGQRRLPGRHPKGDGRGDHAQHTGREVGLAAPQAQPTAGEGPGLGRPRPEEPWGAARKLDQGRCIHGSTRTTSGCTRTRARAQGWKCPRQVLVAPLVVN